MKNISIWIKFDEDFPSLERIKQENWKDQYSNLIDDLDSKKMKCGVDFLKDFILDKNIALNCSINDLLEIECFSSRTAGGKEFINYISVKGFVCRLVVKRFCDKDTLDLCFEFERNDYIEYPVEARQKEILQDLYELNQKINTLYKDRNNFF